MTPPCALPGFFALKVVELRSPGAVLPEIAALKRNTPIDIEHRFDRERMSWPLLYL